MGASHKKHGVIPAPTSISRTRQTCIPGLSYKSGTCARRSGSPGRRRSNKKLKIAKRPGRFVPYCRRAKGQPTTGTEVGEI
jgi:hypothetical protein